METNTLEKENKIKTNSYKKENDLELIKTNPKNSNIKIFQTFIILSIIFLLILSLSFIIFTLKTLNNKNIISNIYISGYNVSNLNKKQALDNLNIYISSKIPEEIKLVHNGYETSILTKDLNIKFDINSAINLAYNIGRNGNLIENDIITLKSLFNKTKIEPILTIDKNFLKNNLENISSKLPDAVIESSYYIENSNLILTKGKKGNIIDIEKTSNDIIEKIKNLNLIDNPIEISTIEVSPSKLNIEKIHKELYKEPKDAYFTQNPYNVYASENGIDFSISLEEAKNLLKKEQDEYIIPLKILYPKTTTNMLGKEAFPDILSSYSTNYSAKNRNRTTNLILAANKINGTVIMPGEIFSYNKIVGERTISAGYKNAPIYVEGKVVDGLGGGICQITTTLYNAVLLSNLEIIERTNHQFVPSYARASRDATVVYGALDFKFKNNRNYPIKIMCSVSRGIANFQILGLKQNNDYQVEITDRITKKTPNSIYSEAYKTLKQNGQIISTKRISKDIYKRH